MCHKKRCQYVLEINGYKVQLRQIMLQNILTYNVVSLDKSAIAYYFTFTNKMI